MPTKKISIVLDAPDKLLQLPSSDYMTGVTRARVRGLIYKNSGGDATLTVSIAELDQGRHILADGTHQSRTVVMFLMPTNSTTAILNTDGWDATFREPQMISRLTFQCRLDGVPGSANISSGNPVHVELEFDYGS